MSVCRECRYVGNVGNDMSDVRYICRNVGNVGKVRNEKGGVSAISELLNVNVGIVSGVERFGTYVPIRGWRRTSSHFKYLSETGTNEDS